MAGQGTPAYRWHEPVASRGRVLMLGTGTAGLLGLAVVSLVVQNWDLGIIAAALGAAAGADLWAETRPRGFVLAGVDGIVASTGRRTTVLAWSEVTGIHVQRRRFGRDRVVVRTRDGVVVRLPRDVGAEDLRQQRPPDGPAVSDSTVEPAS